MTDPNPADLQSRRWVLKTLTGSVFAGSSLALLDGRADAAPAAPAIEVKPGFSVFPRDAWGADLKPKSAMADEDVRFLLVHHSGAHVKRRDARPLIRSIYRHHTREKRWPDVAYNFFVAQDGSVWEGRAGSIERAVRCDATGGSQGFAQLVCVIGNYEAKRPTATVMTSLTNVLAWLAERHGVDTSPGAVTSFVSRGSNLRKRGTEVVTPTIVGHRDMSRTVCPSRHLYARLDEVRAGVHVQRSLWLPT